MNRSCVAATGNVSEHDAPLVSVVVPCYNQAHFLRNVIESALAQTYPHVELVVGDDGSPDNETDVVANYRVARYIRQENRGVAEARNTGFRASNGEFVLFIDADDRLTPNGVQEHLRCFAEHPEAGFVVGGIEHITGDGSYRGAPHWPVLEADHYKHMLAVNHIANTIAVMFRRSVLETVGGFKSIFHPRRIMNCCFGLRGRFRVRTILRSWHITAVTRRTLRVRESLCCRQRDV